MSREAWRALQVGLLGLALACVVLLAGCGVIEPGPTWDEMSDDQRRVHCEGIQTRYEVTDWSRARRSGPVYRYLSLQLNRCERGGYL